MGEPKDKPKEIEVEKFDSRKIEIMDVENLREGPEKFPNFITQNSRKYRRSVIIGSLSHKAYEFLKANKDKAFLSREIAEALNAYKKSLITCMEVLLKNNFIYSSGFKIPVNGANVKYGAYLYSYSQKAILKRIFQETPEEVKRCLFLIDSQRDRIFSSDDLIRLTNVDRLDMKNWLHDIYHNRLGLIGSKWVPGFCRFYFHKDLSEEEFEVLYQRDYKEKLVEHGRVAYLSGREFQEFAIWTFQKYLELKGIKIEIKNLDSEPIDHIGFLNLDLSDVFEDGNERKITLCKFVMSCKHTCLNKPLGAWYITGFSGCLREGITFRGTPIFEPRNTIGIIFCTSASEYAYKACATTGIRIIDLPKLMKMHNLVKETTGQEHPFFKKIALNVDAFREYKRGIYNVKRI